MTTEREVVTGDRGDYTVDTGIVIVTGSVKITRENNQLDGGYAVVDLNTGVSKLFPTAPGAAPGGDQRVKGLFVPQKKQTPPAEGASGSAPDAQAPASTPSSSSAPSLRLKGH